ncbi:MAG: class I SAM-dependent methyltransferase [Candidatus Nealsonbacteria bacterium]
MNFINPSEILNQVPLRSNMIAADFGSGSGGWVIPLARKLEEGRVYAIDLMREPVSALIGKANQERLLNIETVVSNVEGKEGSGLRPEFCDLVLMTNLLFECENKKKVLEEGKRVLKPEGLLLVVDWKTNTPFGPNGGKISAEEVKKIANEMGFKTEKEFDAGNYHYALVFKKT